jgi:hypothetical protein
MSTVLELNPGRGVTVTDGHAERKALGLPDTEATPGHQGKHIDGTGGAFDGSGSERWPNQGWTTAGDGTNYPGLPNAALPSSVPIYDQNVPTQAQADAVVHNAKKEWTPAPPKKV